MRSISDVRLRVAAVLFCLLPALPAMAAMPRLVEVRLDAAATQQPASGRLLLFAIPAAQARAAAKDGKVTQVSASPFSPELVSVAATEVTDLTPGQSVVVDADAIAYPASFSRLPDGDYYVQAVLDANHDYNYGGRGPGDLVSEPTLLHFAAGGTPLALSLSSELPTPGDPWQIPDTAPQALRDTANAAHAQATEIDFASPALSAFWGRPIHMRGWVLVPPGYASQAEHRYPTVYYTHGFGVNRDNLLGPLLQVDAYIRSGAMPPMIWVFLDESSATGTHEFADSVNNGPWSQALTTELIPALERQYRMDGKSSGRFLNGHSSGGWATLWLQVAYPKVFGGTWSTSPDPSDFHDFIGIDLYAQDANVYHGPDGARRPLVRNAGKVVATTEQFARLENVLGPYGGQMASFDWVFSPRGVDGRPMPMFDRDTGAVDPQVIAYWRDHYDIAHKLQTQWPVLKPDLDGKIHVIVGDADTFYLDGAAHKLEVVLDGLGAESDIRFLPGRTHFDLYTVGDDRRALLKTIAWEMYAIARPGAHPEPATGDKPAIP